MMLDLNGLPKNQNGFRTTHTCELCGFEPKTKNKYREKQDHLVMKHFKEKIDKIFPHCRPYACPAPECPFTGKDKQALLRHYTGKHGILERYLKEALAEKGIDYSPNENGKRRHSEVNGNGKTKNPRLSLSPPGNGLSPTNTVIIDYPGELPTKPLPVASRQNTEELRKEVEAMIRSFNPVDQQVVVQVSSPPTSVTLSSGLVKSSPNTNGMNGNHHHTPSTQGTQNGTGAQTTVITSSSSTNNLPAIVLSAVANATAASMAARVNSVVNLPTQPSNVPTITVTAPPQPQTLAIVTKTSAGNMVVQPSAAVQPLPISVITNGNPDSLTLSDMKTNGSSTSPSPVLLENEDVMWSSASNSGPAVVVEAANSLPVAYIDSSSEAVSFAATAATIEAVDFDYLYPVTTTSVPDVRERQLDFNML